MTAKAAISALLNATVVNATITKMDVPLDNCRVYQWKKPIQRESVTHRKVIIGTKLIAEKKAIKTYKIMD